MGWCRKAPSSLHGHRPLSEQDFAFGDGPSLELCPGSLQVSFKAELELVASLCQQHDMLCHTDKVYQWLV